MLRWGLLAVSGLLASCPRAPLAPVRETSVPVELGAIVAHVSGVPEGAPGIRVELRGAEKNVVVSKPIDACHEAVFEGLLDGSYAARAEYEGRSAAVDDVPVRRGHDSLVNLELQPATASPTASREGRSCTPPRYLSGPDVVPPSGTRQSRDGRCLVAKCVITAQGTVRDCVALQPVAGITDIAIETLERRQYTPMMCDGVPSDSDYTFRIRFR